MADIDYPTASLPCMISGTFVENATDPWVQDQGEVGAFRRRKRFTRSLRTFSYSMRLTSEQRTALIEFYEATLDDGVLEFNWTHPWAGLEYEVRFAGRPALDHRYAGKWQVEVALEQI